MKRLRTVIVDDEPIARQVLREELASFADIEIVGEAGDGSEALARISLEQPDLVLLDLQMPGMGGFEVIHRLPPGVVPAVVIVTAFDQHAIAAFEAGALDYLLKPVSRDRLEKALDRVRYLRPGSREAAESLVRLGSAVAGAPRKIAGRAGAEYFLIDFADVVAFQAVREVVWIITARQKYIATQSLRGIESRLPPSTFQRVHRNSLVNLNHIFKMTPLSSQRWMLTLTGGQELIVSKRLAHNIRRLLHW